MRKYPFFIVMLWFHLGAQVLAADESIELRVMSFNVWCGGDPPGV